jgi:GWxTD domain-containing protein
MKRLFLLGFLLLGLSVFTTSLFAQQRQKVPSEEHKKLREFYLIREWPGKHKPIMQTMVPDSISQKPMTEEKYFQSLNPQQQNLYMENFWKMRKDVALEKEYEKRLDWVENNLVLEDTPWENDMGETVLLCGIPPEITVYETEKTESRSHVIDSGLLGKWILTSGSVSKESLWVWTYEVEGVGIVVYKFVSGRLKTTAGSHRARLQDKFEEQCATTWAPTEEGWRIWHGIQGENISRIPWN